MPRKCCVTGCSSNYDSVKKKTKVFRLPSDPEERQRWMKAIPRDNIPDKHDTVVCEKHFPPDVPVIKVKGKERPANPPSIFDHLPKSLVPTPPPLKRRTLKAESSARRVYEEDQLLSFQSSDRITSFDQLLSKISENIGNSVSHYTFGDCCFIQSKELEDDTGIASYVLKISQDLSFKAFHVGVQCTITALVKNRITRFNSWSQIEEALRHLYAMEVDRKKMILLQQAECMGKHKQFEQKYSPEVIVRAFEYFACSRSLYHRLREDFQLPSITTLKRITSKVSKVSDDTYISSIFSKLNSGQKLCRSSLSSLFIDIANGYKLESIERKHGNILANIFFNNYCHLHTPGSDKEPQLKVLKLSC